MIIQPNIFYLKMVYRTILSWEFGAGIVNIFYLKWSLPLKTFQIEHIRIYYACPPLQAQVIQFMCRTQQNLGVLMPSKSISNRRYSTILFLPTPESADSRLLCAKLGILMCFQRHFKHSKTLSLPTPESQDSPILCAKLGVFMPSQRHFNSKIFKYIIPAHPCQCRFANFVQNLVFSCLAKVISNRRYSNILFLPAPTSQYSSVLCFEAFPKAFQIEDIQIHYSCPRVPV